MAYDPLGLDQPGTEGVPTGYDPLGLGPEEKQPSYLEAAKTGLKEGLAGAMRMYEIPSRGILERTGLAAPGTFASELLKPTEEEEKRVGELGIRGQIVRGVAGLPGAFAKYVPLMAAAPAGIIGTGLTFAGERAAEELAAGKKPSPAQLGEEAIIGGIFRGIEPLGRLARAAILSGTFSTQAFGETYAQTKDLKRSLEAAVAPGVIGAGLGAMGKGRPGERPAVAPGVIGAGLKGRPGERPIPRAGEEEIRQIPPIPESRYQMGTPGWPRPEGLPYPVVPYGRGGPIAEMVWNPRTQRFETGDYFKVEPGGPSEPPPIGPPGELTWTSTGSPPPPPDWIREGREFPPPQYPPIPYIPRPTGRPSEPIIPPTPTPTPPPIPKTPGVATMPATDRQMTTVRENAADIGGLSIDLIKRWTGLGTKRANAILEGMASADEIERSLPGEPYPWRLKATVAPPKPFKTGFIPGTYKDKLAKEFNETINKRFPENEDLRALHKEIIDLYFAVEAGQPGKRIFIAGGGRVGEGSNLDVIGEASTYPEFISKNKFDRKGTLRALAKGIKGQKLGKKEEEIYTQARVESKEAIEAKKAESDRYDREYAEILDREPELTNPELTNHIDDEIMGLKEDLRENYTDAEINTAIEEATKNLTPEGAPPDLAAIEAGIRSFLIPKVELPTPLPAPSPTRPGEQLLPGMKVGLEMAGAKGRVTPTLEGSPLMEAARKAEMERVQPGLPLGLFAQEDKAQQLDRGISDGEIRLKSGVNALGEKLSPLEMESIRRSVEAARGEKQAMPETPQMRDSLSDFQADPLKYIPDDLIIDAKGIREKTGKEVTIKQNAKEAYNEITDRLKTFKDFWDCVKS